MGVERVIIKAVRAATARLDTSSESVGSEAYGSLLAPIS